MVDVEGELSEEEELELNEFRKQDESREWKFWDDVSGRELPADRVKAARQEEIEVVRNMRVWKKVPK